MYFVVKKTYFDGSKSLSIDEQLIYYVLDGKNVLKCAKGAKWTILFANLGQPSEQIT